MKVLVTGGAGYIGTELISHLSRNSSVEEVIVYDNLSRGNFSFFLNGGLDGGKVKFVQGDILDSRNLRKQLEGVDTVYHLAARVTTPFANTDAHDYEQVNHWGTAELVYAVEESDVSKFIYVSSASVYGSSKEHLDENRTVNPKTLYGISKMRGEEHVFRLQDKMETYVMRCGNVYGYSRSMRFDAVINRFTFDANFSNRISIHGNGKQSRSFIHIDLISDVLEKLLDKSIPSDIYNLVDKNLSVLDLVDVFKEVYPNLEFIFINQHLSLREMKINASEKLKKYIPFENNNSLKNEILDFKKKLSF
ncbi:MAG: SDR family oxidoreductase [Bacteroidota bacterium]